jgi:tricorn protease
MIRTRHSLIAFLASLLMASAVRAQEPIRFARTPDISPDGKLVAFSYLGDIWTVESIGGVARRVTVHEAHDIYPIFSPGDGRSIAFSSNRYGSYDVFVIPTQGGKPRRLTYDSAQDVACGWSPDGKSILFTSSRGTDYPAAQDLYAVPVAGGRVIRVTHTEGKDGAYSPTGDQIAYVRGPGIWYRKGYRGSANDDIWLCNADGSNHRRLTTADCQDNAPMWSPDGKWIYYVSEVLGTPANIVKQDVLGKTPPQRVTFHKDDAVRRARISGNGEWIVYECGADLWVASTREGESPRKLPIEVDADDKVNPEEIVTLTQGATEYALSADESHAAFVLRGQLFLMPIRPGSKVRRLATSAFYDHSPAWSPDGTQIVFASDRGGQEDLYLLEAEEGRKKIHEATQLKVKQLTDSREPEAAPSFAPNGKLIAFVRAGQLWTMKPDGSEQKPLVATPEVIDYEWSPDSKWLAYARLDGSFASEIYIIPATGGESKNVTRYATFNAGITWSAKDMKLAFVSERRRSFQLCVMALQKAAVEGAPASTDIDWEDIHLRVRPAAPVTAVEGAISSDGKKVAFRSAGSTGDDLWVASTDGSDVTRVTHGNLRPRQIQWSKRYPDLIYFRDNKGMLRLARLSLSSVLGSSSSSSTSGTSRSDTATVPFKVKMTVRREDEFKEMFEQSWRALSEGFYDPKFSGVDWHTLRSKYRPLIKHCALKEDLYALIYLMLGELNASHLGISGLIATPEEMTGSLGFVFYDTYAGPGLKVKEILKRGPADRRGLAIKADDVIVAIDGTELTDQVNISKLLNDKVGETVALQVVPEGANLKDPKARRHVRTQAISQRQTYTLMYDRWVEHNARRVSELSGGKLGYIHIPSMNEEGLDRFVRALYSDNLDKEAIVLDVRFNSGGNTHDEVLNYLGAREHTLFRQRDGGQGWVLRSYDRKWTKPIVLLINNQSFSDAEILPSAVRTLGLGKLVGQPTGGQVIGTVNIALIDGSTFRIPRTGVYTLKGVNMDKEGVAPDELVENLPDQLARGVDAQLDKAVEVLQKEVTVWKKTHSSVAVKPDSGKSAEAPAAGPPPLSK